MKIRMVNIDSSPKAMLKKTQDALSTRLAHLGGGAFAQAYAAPDGNVIKVGTHAGRHNPDLLPLLRDGWLEWVRQSSALPSIYAPKVHEITLYVHKNRTGFYVAKMERFTSTFNDLDMDSRCDSLSALAGEECCCLSELQHCFGAMRRRGKDRANLADALERTWDKYGNDLHAGNAMTRPDGTLVITDPASWALAGLLN